MKKWSQLNVSSSHCYKNYSKWSSPLEKCRPGNEKAPCWCRNILPLAHTDILLSSMLEISSGIWSRNITVMLQENSVRSSNYNCQKKLPEIRRMGRGSPGLRHFQQISNKVKWLLSLCFIDYRLFFIVYHLFFILYRLSFILYWLLFILY